MKKLNKLTFKTEAVDLEQDDGRGEYLAFYFYEDASGLLRDDVLIDDAPWYVQNVLEKLLP